MKNNFYPKLQKKFGGKWVATSKAGKKVFAASENVDTLYDKLARKNVKPQKTVIGYIEKPETINVYLKISLS